VLPGASNLPNGTVSYTNGTATATTHFYLVKAVGIGGASNGDYQAAKFVRALPGGPNLLSVPIILQDTSSANTFQSLPGVESVRYYEASDSADPWKAYYPGRPGDSTVDHRHALWVNVTSAGEWRIAGRVPNTTQINLVAGWNFVAYPSFINRQAGTVFTPLLVSRIEAFDAAAGPYYLRVFAMTETLRAGNGYWVVVPAAATWNVANS